MTPESPVEYSVPMSRHINHLSSNTNQHPTPSYPSHSFKPQNQSPLQSPCQQLLHELREFRKLSSPSNQLLRELREFRKLSSPSQQLLRELQQIKTPSSYHKHKHPSRSKPPYLPSNPNNPENPSNPENPNDQFLHEDSGIELTSDEDSPPSPSTPPPRTQPRTPPHNPPPSPYPTPKRQRRQRQQQQPGTREIRGIRGIREIQDPGSPLMYRGVGWGGPEQGREPHQQRQQQQQQQEEQDPEKRYMTRATKMRLE
ncbi:hypothetical protein BZA77DRAFT_389953 [Pyronema omphalodes]|nr:hypothetical protein BZA77DRAFT_389953 [Pyronema omphalodes]